MPGERSGDETAVSLDGNQYLPVETAPDERGSALGFALLARSLIADARFAAGIDSPTERPLSEWLNFIRGMLAAYLVPVDDAEEGLLGRCRTALDDLEDVGLQNLPVSYRVAAEWCAARSRPSRRARGILARGVTVASFVPCGPSHSAWFSCWDWARPISRATRAADLGIWRRPEATSRPARGSLHVPGDAAVHAPHGSPPCQWARDEGGDGRTVAATPAALELREILLSGTP